MRKEVTVQLDDILGLIACAEDYGYGFSTFYGGMADFLNRKLTDEEINNYASWFLSDEAKSKNYAQEDFDTAIKRLTEFRNRYCK